MIRCPNCGSSAQPKVVYSYLIVSPKHILVREYKCGCGCEFETEEIKLEEKIKKVLTNQ